MPSDAVERPAGPPPEEIADELNAAGFIEPREVGRGGFGIVYRCRQPALDREVAVKVMSPGSDRTDRVRFLREQQAMGRLSGHPNIVHVLEAGVTRYERPYIVMPFHPPPRFPRSVDQPTRAAHGRRNARYRNQDGRCPRDGTSSQCSAP